MRFIPQTLFDDALTEILAGAKCKDIADQLGLDCEYFGRLLGLPATTPAEPAADGFDLWAVDRLAEVL